MTHAHLRKSGVVSWKPMLRLLLRAAPAEDPAALGS
jgi:hypothetical protein